MTGNPTWNLPWNVNCHVNCEVLQPKTKEAKKALFKWRSCCFATHLHRITEGLSSDCWCSVNLSLKTQQREITGCQEFTHTIGSKLQEQAGKSLCYCYSICKPHQQFLAFETCRIMQETQCLLIGASSANSHASCWLWDARIENNHFLVIH